MPKPRQLKSGKWNIELKAEAWSTTEDTPEECVIKAKAVRAGFLETRKTSGATLSAAIDKYIDAKSNVLSPTTIRTYRIIQRNRFPELMSMRVSSITRSIAQTAVNSAATKYASKTLHSAWAFIQTVIQNETGTRLDVTCPQVVSDERPWLTPQQISVFVSAVQGLPCEIPALLALSSLRLSEISGLTWDNIDLKKHIIHVRGAAVYDENNKLVHKETNKNKASRRDVPIMQEQLYNALSAVESKTGAVVSTSPNAIRVQINRVCRANSLPEVGVHGLRHSFASLAASIRMPEEHAMRIGGWANDYTMKKIYTHVSEMDIDLSKSEMAKFYNG